MKRVYQTSEETYYAKYYKTPYDGYIDEYDLEALSKEYNCGVITESTPRIISLAEKICDVNNSLADSLKEPITKLVQEVIDLGNSKKWWINPNNKLVSYSIDVNNFGISIKIFIVSSELSEYPKLMSTMNQKQITDLLTDVINKYIPDSKFVSFELI